MKIRHYLHAAYRYLRKKMVPPLFARCFSYGYRFFLLFFRCRIDGEELFQRLLQEGGCILLLWHRHLLLLPHCLQKVGANCRYGAIVSRSRDGAFIEAIARRYGSRVTIIGVEAKKRHLALLEAHKILGEVEVLLITPDGPRGPSQKVKMGAIDLSFRSGLPILPFTWTSDRCWTLKSWDRFLIPKPFANVTLSFLPPIYPTTTREELKREVEEMLNQKREEEPLSDLA